MKPYLRTVHEEITQIVDQDSGELIDVHSKKTDIVVTSREEFVQLYTSIESKLIGLTLSEERLFLFAALNCDRNNIIMFNSYNRKQIMEKWQLAESTIYNGLVKLHKEGILVKIAKGVYRVNPIYVWKGNTNERKVMLKHFLSVECRHC